MPTKICRNIVVFVLVLSLLPNTVWAQSSYQKKQFEPFLTRGNTTFSINGGLRNNKTSGVDEASDITGLATPNIQFENPYDDVSIIELQAKMRHTEPAGIAFINGAIIGEAEVRAGVIVDGFAQLSQYAGDNRTLEILRRSTNELEGDSVGGSVTLGYKVELTGTPGLKAKRSLTSVPKTARERRVRERKLYKALESPGPYVSVAPLVGYGVDQTTYETTSVFEVIPTFTNFSTDYVYVADFYGPFFGMETEIKNKKHMLRLRGQYHNLTFDGEVNDNSTGGNFVYEGDGSGLTINGEYAYALGHDYALTLEGFYQSREIDEGTAQRDFGNGVTDTVKTGEVTDESHALRIGVRYNWD